MHDIIFFILTAVSIMGQLSDIYTTEVGLAHKEIETNPAVTWFISKIGLSGVMLIKGVGIGTLLPIVLYAFTTPAMGIIAAGASAIIGFTAGISNYLNLRKAKIPLGLFGL